MERQVISSRSVMDPITFPDMFFSSTSASNLVLCLMIPHYWQGYFSSSLTLFAYKWCFESGCHCRFFFLKWGDIIWFFPVRKKKKSVHLERLEKERLSLNKMHGLTLFEKWVGASLRKQGQTLTWLKSMIGLVVKNLSFGALPWRGKQHRGRDPVHLHLGTCLCLDYSELHISVIDVNMWRLLKRFFSHVRYYYLDFYWQSALGLKRY